MTPSINFLLLTITYVLGQNFWHFKNSRGSLRDSSFARSHSAQGGSQSSRSRSPPDPTWSAVVPERLSSAPPRLAELNWHKISVNLNDTLPVGEMLDRPYMSWPGRTRDLYTVIVVDEGITAIDTGGKGYVHWLKTNVPNSRIDLGIEAMQYVPPFSLELTSEGTIDKNGNPHPILVLVYKQPGKIEVEETQQGCTPGLLGRFEDKNALVLKYGLELYAGTFFWVPWGGRATEKLVCRFSRCFRQSFPVPLPGINNGSECQPSEEILDTSFLAPKLSQLAEFGKAISEFNPDSITSRIRELKDQGVSTGVTREFRALYGLFRTTPSLTNENLAATEEGEMSAIFFKYQDEEGAKQIFAPFDQFVSKFPAAVQSFGRAASTFAGDGKTYAVVLSKPEDQDFDTESLLIEPNSVIWMQMANVKLGKEEQFQELRNKFIHQKVANSPLVTAIYKFEVNRDILERVGKDSPFYHDNSRVELMLYTARSVEDQQAFITGLSKDDPQFLNDFLSTYDCIVCAALSHNLIPESYPPFSIK